MQNRYLHSIVLLTLLGSLPAVLCWKFFTAKQAAQPVERELTGHKFGPSQIDFQRIKLRAGAALPPRISNVQVVDFDGDGKNEVMICDTRRHQLIAMRWQSDGVFEEEVVAGNLSFPAHAEFADIDGDGDLDALVSLLGDIWPNDALVGGLVWLEQHETGIRRHDLLTNVSRVADARSGDLDGDGDMDIVVASFGYSRGEILWLENLGEGQFTQTTLIHAAGAIHTPLADFDNDGDLDIAAVISQDREETVLFENLGDRNFKMRSLFSTSNFDLGSAGLVADDLDKDGDIDLLLPAGDNLEYEHTHPQPYHGVYFIQNMGDLKFTSRKIASFGGTFAMTVGDIDYDGDRDLLLASMFNNWRHDEMTSVALFSNDGVQNFTPTEIDHAPTHLATIAVGDINHDGKDDLIAGSLWLTTSYSEAEPLTAWIREVR